jgi:hypothetical protein
MSRLATFFKGADIASGAFHPKEYLIARFSTLEEAESAKTELNGTGHSHVIAVPGEEVVAFAQENSHEEGFLGMALTQLSRAFGTEAEYGDKDLESAKNGDAFLAVHCPDENTKTQAWSVLQSKHPLVARYYSSGGIEHLVGEI